MICIQICVGGPTHGVQQVILALGAWLPAAQHFVLSLTAHALKTTLLYGLRHVNHDHGFPWRARATVCWWGGSDVSWGRRKNGGTTESSVSARGNALVALQSSETSWRAVQNCEVKLVRSLYVYECNLQLERSVICKQMIWALYLTHLVSEQTHSMLGQCSNLFNFFFIVVGS